MEKSVFPLLLLAALFLSCTASRGRQSRQHASLPAAAPGPGSCVIEGKIIRILPVLEADRGSVCARYPCRAMVRLQAPPVCDAGVSAPLNAGDTVELYFAYSLHRTAQALPSLREHYPGLKKGAVFTATATQRLQPGEPGIFWIYGYKVK